MWEIVGVCVAQLIAGYIGSQNDNTPIGQAALSFEKIVDIANKIASIELELKDLITAVADAVQAIKRDRLDDEMGQYYTQMKSACSDIEDQITTIKNLGEAANDPKNSTVLRCLYALQNQMPTVHNAILQFARLDGGSDKKPPTLQTYFSCSASVGMWARAYQMINVYTPAAPPIHESKGSKLLREVYQPFFEDVDRIVTENESALYGPLLIPKGVVCRFVSDHFESSTGLTPPGAYQCETANPGEEPTVLNVYTGIGHRPWVPEKPNAPAAQVFSSLLQRRVPFVQRLSNYSPVLQTAVKSMGVFDGKLNRRHNDARFESITRNS